MSDKAKEKKSVPERFVRGAARFVGGIALAAAGIYVAGGILHAAGANFAHPFSQ